MSKILEAARFARKAHEGQKRKYNGDPYIYHPARVAGMVATHWAATEDMIAAAFLHDVLEDTETGWTVLMEEFGPEVAFLVDEMTNKSKKLLPNGSREERKKADRKRIQNISNAAKIIKMFDRLDNVRELSKEKEAPADFKAMYARESLALVEVLEEADSYLGIVLRSAITDLLK